MAVVLMAFWVILNGRFAPDTLITGAVMGAAVWLCLILFAGWSGRKEWRVIRLAPLAAAYAFFLLAEIFKANMGVLKVILFHRPEPVIRVIQTPLKSKAARVVLANSITLTPGTVTVRLEGDTLTVHALTKEIAEGLTDFSLEKRLLKMEEKAHGKSV